MVLAMEEDEQIVLSTEASPVRDTDSVVSPMSPGVVELPANNEEECEIDIIQEFRHRMSELAINRSSVGSSKVKHTSTSSESAITTSDDSLFEAISPTSWLSLNTSTLLPTRGRIYHTQMRSDHLLFGGSIDGRTLDDGIWANGSDLKKKQVVQHSRSYSGAEYGHPHVIEAVTSAMQHLRDVRHQEHISRPIRFESQNKLHKPTAETPKIFGASVNDGFQITRLTTRDWLRVTTWWLLKMSSPCKADRIQDLLKIYQGSATLANCNRHNYVSARGSLSPSTESRSTSHQVYLDLLKASYILYDIVLEEEASPALLGDEDRKSIVELSEVGAFVTLTPTCDWFNLGHK
jgi:hypothetical protein